jgi:hypothetical protein
LCWSASAAKSPYVADEWRYALQLARPNFVRPIYWHTPMITPPAELAHLHFQRLQLT